MQFKRIWFFSSIPGTPNRDYGIPNRDYGIPNRGLWLISRTEHRGFIQEMYPMKLLRLNSKFLNRLWLLCIHVLGELQLRSN
ncbi:hypothetical protein LXL04_016072 [Taraxacum kok-saghyz]